MQALRHPGCVRALLSLVIWIVMLNERRNGEISLSRVWQLMKARSKLQETCIALLRRAREQQHQQNGAVNGDDGRKRPERGLTAGSFMHHLAHAKHHPNVKGGSEFSEMEIVQQVRHF
jgi:hypothetical protein